MIVTKQIGVPNVHGYVMVDGKKYIVESIYENKGGFITYTILIRHRVDEFAEIVCMGDVNKKYWGIIEYPIHHGDARIVKEIMFIDA